MTARVSPTIEAIETRRAVQHRAENRHRWFEPVIEPGDTRRYRPILNVLWNLAGLALFIIVAGLSAGWLLEVRS